MKMKIFTPKITITAASITSIMAVFLTMMIYSPISSPTIQIHIAYACGGCWHVTPGSTYPAQFNDNDLGQIVKMSCTVLSNDGKGKITTSCLEQ
jgi:hypothetical protein